MIDFLRGFFNNYSQLQMIYAVLPYIVSALIIVLYARFFLKQIRYSLLVLGLLVQGLISFKLYLFNFQVRLPLFDYSSLYFVTVPLILMTVLTLITSSKVTAMVKIKREDLKARRNEVLTLHISVTIFALALEGVLQYFHFNIYAYTLSVLTTLLPVLVSYLVFRTLFKEQK